MSNCLTCGIKTTDLYKHHIVPVSRGGLEYEGNLISVCGTCHGKIHGKLDMSYLTAFEKRHGDSFAAYMAELDSVESDEQLCDRFGINHALLTTLKRAAGIIPSGCEKRYCLEPDGYGDFIGSWIYVNWRETK
jgi:hypothetical protein